ncbi:hypothetical protein SLS53_008734 [Cytospora paraplurivora]|uniref:Uncharacterized protein n=1 Tax=Cytospora paraplurivora TaxID=2898453 RepID=A0AAN9YB26_9PEZI
MGPDIDININIIIIIIIIIDAAATKLRNNGTPTTVSSDYQHCHSDLHGHLQQQCVDNKDTNKDNKDNNEEMQELLATLIERSLPAPDKPQTP